VESNEAKYVTYLEAIRQTLFEEMRRDERVFCMGEDIGVFGGAFKVTKGLIDEFGADRVIDTPIAESAMLGMAIGAAISGLRPVVEMQFADFVSNGFTQLSVNAAKTHYRWGQSVPLVVRLPAGGGVSGGPFHSANPEGWFSNVPGLKLVAPATVSDARGLLLAAIRDENPVLFFEHKYLYRRVKDISESSTREIVPIGKARIAREGINATIVTYGAMVGKAEEVARELAQESVEIEIIDLRSLIPWDSQSVINSVKKTSRVLVLHEATKTGGIGAEIAAVLSEKAFEYLDAPIVRLASEDTPVPFAPVLEDFFMPNAAKIRAALERLLSY